MRRSTLVFGTIVQLLVLAIPASAQVPGPSDQDPFGREPQLSASLKVEVTPRQTQVFIDGYYAGIADDFDGAFQQLRIEPGEHDVQLYLPGYRLHVEHVRLQSGATVKVRHSMQRLAAGEGEPRRPSATPRPPRTFAPNPDRPSAVRREYGSLSIRVQPADAEIVVDGTPWISQGDAPLVVQLAVGPHTVEVKKNGYRPYLTEITVRENDITPLNISLSKGP